MSESNKNIFITWGGCGAFDVIMHDVNISFDPYLFGENLEKAEPVFDYIFISHEHFDHCHPETLKKLCTGPRFKKLYVPIGCISPAQPIAEKYGDAAFARDLPITQHIPEENIEIVYPKHLREDQGLDRKFPGPCELDMGPLHVEIIESGENQRPDLCTCGYLVEHKQKNVSFLHTGDLHKPYQALKAIHGRTDFLIHMKLGLTEWDREDSASRLVELLESIGAKFLIPTHYRTNRVDDPVPEGHWPPNITDVAAFIESIRETTGDRAQVLPLTAGIEYEVEMPAKRILWKWNWFNSWTVPPWRE